MQIDYDSSKNEVSPQDKKGCLSYERTPLIRASNLVISLSLCSDRTCDVERRKTSPFRVETILPDVIFLQVFTTTLPEHEYRRSRRTLQQSSQACAFAHASLNPKTPKTPKNDLQGAAVMRCSLLAADIACTPSMF